VSLSPFLKASVALHAAAIPTLAIAPHRWPYVAGALVANHYVTIAGGLLPRSTLLGPNVRRSAAAKAAGAVVLTFDDGPDPVVTPLVLDALDARGAKATFFCIGEHAARHRALTAEIALRGHRLENHSYSHSNAFFFHRPATLDSEIRRCQDELQRASGRGPSFFRAPAGIRSPLLEGVLLRNGLRLASWTRRGFDTASRSAKAVASRLTRDLSAGDVVLLHDGARRERADRAHVVLAALAIVLDAIETAHLRVQPLMDEAPDRA
jgi:peptidoglycan/xylan/chitin deacetylase (PgdA/CDA1 family)